VGDLVVVEEIPHQLIPVQVAVPEDLGRREWVLLAVLVVVVLVKVVLEALLVQ